MSAAGRERMGEPGASAAIASEIVARLRRARDRNVQSATTEIAM